MTKVCILFNRYFLQQGIVLEAYNSIQDHFSLSDIQDDLNFDGEDNQYSQNHKLYETGKLL